MTDTLNLPELPKSEWHPWGAPVYTADQMRAYATAAVLAATAPLIEILETIAAQGSGDPTSTSRADCMAAIAALAIRGSSERCASIVEAQPQPTICWGLSSFCAEVGHKCRAAGLCVYAPPNAEAQPTAGVTPCRLCGGTGRYGDGAHDGSGRWIECPNCDGSIAAPDHQTPSAQPQGEG